MSAKEDAVLNLCNLPSDVIRKIIEVGLNCIDDVKLITPRWNVLVRENLEDSTRHPSIKRCYCEFAYNTKIRIKITFPVAFKKYFGMQNQPSAPNRPGVPLPASDGICEFLLDVAQLIDSFGKQIDFLRKVLDRCSSVDLLLLILNNAEEFLLYKFPINPLKIDELKLSRFCPEKISANFYEETVNFLKYHSVRLLCVRVSNKCIEALGELTDFFIDCSSAVETLKFLGGAFPDALARRRADWEAATEWLNETGEVMATLEEEPDKHDFLNLFLIVKRKADR